MHEGIEERFYKAMTIVSTSGPQEYADYLHGIILFGIIAAILLWIAKSRRYFVLPYSAGKEKPSDVNFKTVLAVFAIYLGMTMLVAPIAAYLVNATYTTILKKSPPLVAMGWVQLFVLGGIFLLFYLFSLTQGTGKFKKIWKDWSIPHPKPILTDILMGILSWFIAFPLVIAVGQLTDMLLYYFFGFQNYEQVAVHYLKKALDSPPLLFVALFTILLAAPVIEEFIFRGCLQTFFKRYMSPVKAILLTAFCFALFHFSTSQGVGNISLVATLFTFAFFLGFIYERQASLFASIALHMTFNFVSTMRIIFFNDG